MSVIYGPPERLHLGKDLCWHSEDSIIAVTVSGHVWIGDECVIGYGVRFLAGWHDYNQRGKERHPFPNSGYDIHIGQGVWLASYCIVLGGVTVANHAVVGAGSVVTRDVPEGQLWAGNPARFITTV